MVSDILGGLQLVSLQHIGFLRLKLVLCLGFSCVDTAWWDNIDDSMKMQVQDNRENHGWSVQHADWIIYMISFSLQIF